jgi:hypothetical protein
VRAMGMCCARAAGAHAAATASWCASCACARPARTIGSRSTQASAGAAAAGADPGRRKAAAEGLSGTRLPDAPPGCAGPD